MARPRVPDLQRKTKITTVRFSPLEVMNLNKLAEDTGMGESEVIREGLSALQRERDAQRSGGKKTP